MLYLWNTLVNATSFIKNKIAIVFIDGYAKPSLNG